MCISLTTCPVAVCTCSDLTTCVKVAADCNTCESFTCISNNQKAGLSTGTLAGAVSGAIALAIIACVAYFYWRRRTAVSRLGVEKPLKRVSDVPARPDAVLSRPDPNLEKATPAPARHRSLHSDAASQHSALSEGAQFMHDPFADQASIQTASARTHSPNVITIGLIPPPDGITALRPPPPAGPQRPLRSPDLSLRAERTFEDAINLAHVNVSNDSLQPPNARFARQSQRSALTTNSSSRASIFSNASSALDILTEAPQIVTPKLANVRQVLGVVKAEVVQAPGSATGPMLSPLSRQASRPARSPLAKQSYTPDDVSETEVNPFEDDCTPAASSATSVKSTSTFGAHTPTNWTFPPTPTWPVDSRPTSIQSNVGTIVADIENATRVVFGMQSPQFSTTATAHTSTATMGTTNTQLPGTPPPTATEEEARRMSQASVASSHADSILEAFPFVPPSPIAARPPRSPMGMTFSPPSPAQSSHSVPPPPSPHRLRAGYPPEPATPTQRTVRMSALSSSSGLSGLGAFPFKFSDSETPPMPQNSRRASLDTLALSRDLEAFPLSYDHPLRDSFTPSTK